MRIHCGPSVGERNKLKLIQLKAEKDRLDKWCPWFAWYPVRVGEDDCRLFETIERRYPNAYVYEYNDGRVTLWKRQPMYRAVAWPEDGM